MGKAGTVTYGDLAAVLRLLVANQRRLMEMLRQTDPQPRARYDAYDAIFADLAAAEDLLDPKRAAAVAPELTIPDPALNRERHP